MKRWYPTNILSACHLVDHCRSKIARILPEKRKENTPIPIKKTQNKIPIIASGGIFTGNDAKEKLNAGASLVQVWTGFVYEGPSIAKNICKALFH